MKFLISIAILQSLIIKFAASSSTYCKDEFEKTICENFAFTPDTVLNSSSNKLLIKNSKGAITKTNLKNLGDVTEIIIRESALDGVEPGALCSMPNLTAVTMINNSKIQEITADVLKNCENLVRINLDGPEIVLTQGAFAETGQLHTLSLNATTLPKKSLEKNFFQGLHSLKSLSITYSKLRKISEDVFDHLRELKFLDLQNNEIEAIPVGVFRKLSQLKVVNLADNKLKNLSWDEFQDLKLLRVLYLERNDFDHVDVQKLIKSVPDLERIFLSYDKLTPQNRKEIEETLPKLNIAIIYSGKSFN